MRSIVLLSVLSFLLPNTSLAEDLEAGSRCELSKDLRVSAKPKGKGKKTKLKKGAILEVVAFAKAWSEVTGEAGSGHVKTKQLTKACTVMEAETPAEEVEVEAAVEETAEETPAEGAAPEETSAEEKPAEGVETPAGVAEGAAAEESAAVDDSSEAGAEVAGDTGADTGTGTDAMVEPAAEETEEIATEATPTEDDTNMLEFGFGLLGPMGVGDVTGFGVGGMLELRYNITENFAAGIRLEGDIMFSGEVKGVSSSVGASVTSAYLLEGEAQLWGSGFSPVGGVALGLYSVGGASSGAGGVGAEAGTLFGVAPKVGLDFGGFRIAALFHLLFGETTVVGASAVKRNFLVIELSGQIGFL